MSKNEELLKALLNDETAEIQPVTRAERYLKACCEKCGCEGLPEPVSRSDELLYELAEKLAHGGGDITTEELEVTENGTYTAPDGKAYTPVTVNVPAVEPVLESLNATENGTYEPEEGVDGFDSVVVAVPAVEPVIEALNVSANGTYNAPSGTDGYNPVVVAVPEAELEQKSVTVTENGTSEIVPAAGKDGISKVNLTVNVPNPSTGSVNITENGTYDVTEKASAVVNVPDADLEVKTVTVTENGTSTIVPSAGKDGIEEVDLTVNVQPDLQSKSATPSLSQQTISPDSGKDGLSAVTVAPVTKELLATLDADFLAENIKKDVDLFGLIGTLESGGGSVEMQTGTITFASDTAIENCEVQHGLSGIPNIVFMIARKTDTFGAPKEPYADYFAYITKKNGSKYAGLFSQTRNQSTSTGRASAYGGKATDNTSTTLNGTDCINANRIRINSADVIPAGGVMYWLAVKTGRIEGE